MTAYLVTNTNDSGQGSFRDAVAQANANPGPDTVTFSPSLAGQTVTLSSQVTISGVTTINGDVNNDDKADVTISGNGSARLLYVDFGSALTVQSVMLSGGNAVNDFGGAIYGLSTVFVINSTLENNTASISGGAIHMQGVPLTVINSTINNNTADFGGGINQQGSSATIVNTTITGNSASVQGGAIDATVSGTINVIDSTIVANNSNGSFAVVIEGGTINIANSVIASNGNGDVGSTLPNTINATNSVFGTDVAGVTGGVNGNLENVLAASLGLGSLADNGGTVKTINITTSSSVLVNAGSNSAIYTGILFDANGQPRIYGVSVDIGATEYQNTAPSVTTSTFFVNEGSVSVGTVLASDTESNPVTFSLTGGADSSSFTLSSSGVLSFNSGPDFENPADAGRNNVYNIQVTASDGKGGIDVESIAITVRDVNEAPVITSNGGGAKAAVDVAEGSTDVTTVVASDPELTDPVYSISGGADSALFDIDPDTGELTFKVAPNFENPTDADDDGVYDVVVKASDGSLFDTQTIAVTVTDVNEDPVITSDGGGDTADISVRENRTQVTTVTAKDPDGRKPFVFGLGKGGDTDLFTIDPDTGVLSFKSAPDFENPTDNGRNNVYQVEVEVSDGNGGFDTQLISVTVTNGNDRPVITSDGGKLRASVDVAENSTAVTKVQASDQDGSSITYAISGGDDKALFSIDATTGKVTFKSAPDFESPQDKNHDNAYQITVRVTDSDGAIDVQYLTINVTDVDGVTITGTEGADTVNVNKTVDGQPLPTGEEDHILGLGGNDRLSGLGGDDILEGGEGKDILKGGAGHDHFVYLDVADSTGTGIDRIRDFTQGDDVIDLSAIDGVFHFLGEAGFDGTAGALRQRTAGADVFLEGDTDGNGVADLVILLKGSSGLLLDGSDLIL